MLFLRDFDKSILENLMNGNATPNQIQLLQNAMTTTTNVTNQMAAWNCPICHQRNFSKKLNCHRCHTKVDENGKVLDTSKTDSRYLPKGNPKSFLPTNSFLLVRVCCLHSSCIFLTDSNVLFRNTSIYMIVEEQRIKKL